MSLAIAVKNSVLLFFGILIAHVLLRGTLDGQLGQFGHQASLDRFEDAGLYAENSCVGDLGDGPVPLPGSTTSSVGAPVPEESAKDNEAQKKADADLYKYVFGDESCADKTTEKPAEKPTEKSARQPEQVPGLVCPPAPPALKAAKQQQALGGPRLQVQQQLRHFIGACSALLQPFHQRRGDQCALLGNASMECHGQRAGDRIIARGGLDQVRLAWRGAPSVGHHHHCHGHSETAHPHRRVPS
jgi:hypothetical protein